MIQTESKTTYPIIVSDVRVGTALPGDVFLTHVTSADDLHGNSLYHRRCWLLAEDEAECDIAKAHHFVEFGAFTYFRNCTHTT